MSTGVAMIPGGQVLVTVVDIGFTFEEVFTSSSKAYEMISASVSSQGTNVLQLWTMFYGFDEYWSYICGESSFFPEFAVIAMIQIVAGIKPQVSKDFGIPIVGGPAHGICGQQVVWALWHQCIRAPEMHCPRAMKSHPAAVEDWPLDDTHEIHVVKL